MRAGIVGQTRMSRRIPGAASLSPGGQQKSSTWRSNSEPAARHCAQPMPTQAAALLVVATDGRSGSCTGRWWPRKRRIWSSRVPVGTVIAELGSVARTVDLVVVDARGRWRCDAYGLRAVIGSARLLLLSTGLLHRFGAGRLPPLEPGHRGLRASSRVRRWPWLVASPVLVLGWRRPCRLRVRMPVLLRPRVGGCEDSRRLAPH